MLKPIQRRPWTCASCLLKQARRQSLVGFAFARKPQDQLDLPVVSHGATEANHDDRTLRKIFDSPSFWSEFQHQSASKTGPRTGLLQNKYLTSPEGFSRFSTDALQKCRKIVARILASSTIEEYKDVVKQLDRLSDQLCRVIDLVEFIRNVHPDAPIQQAANQAHGIMYEYMNVLNTTKGLNDQLMKASAMPEVTSTWSEEEMMTARILLKDFAQSGISGSADSRARFVQVSNDIVRVGSEMVDEMAPERPSLSFPSSRMNGMDPRAVKQLTRLGTTTIPTHGRFAATALRSVHDADVRRQLYMANRTASRASVRRVERLVQSRAELAALSGHESFAHMTLADKMARSPEAVMQFLEALAATNNRTVVRDLSDLLRLKTQTPGASTSPTLDAWDREYYAARQRSHSLTPSGADSDSLSAYFSLGTVMQGLSRLFTRLFGIRLVPRASAPGETWADDVRRLDVIDDTDGHIAVLYCDLFARPHKSPNPAHFTLRSSRAITTSEVAEAHERGSLPASSLSSTHALPLDTLSQALNDGMSLNRSASGATVHQLPTIAFICDFLRPSPSSSSAAPPTLLTFRQVSTLFHEMGHALHSILGRTALQNVAGTRCATDFAELPSVLMEHFAAAAPVLALYARRWDTDAPLQVERVSCELHSGSSGAAAAETESQILLSVLDQRLHGRGVPPASGSGTTSYDSTAAYAAVWNDARFASLPEPAGCAWHGFFGHLFGYGAVYYAYLFDRAIARRVFSEVFDDGRRAAPARSLFGGGAGRGEAAACTSRAAGQRYREEVLRHGGARDPWACVAGLLGGEKAWMREGGAEAMAEVGRWGAGEMGAAGMP